MSAAGFLVWQVSAKGHTTPPSAKSDLQNLSSFHTHRSTARPVGPVALSATPQSHSNKAPWGINSIRARQCRPFTYKPNNVCNASTANRPGTACPPHFSRVRTEINQNTLSFYQLFLRLSIELFCQCSAKRVPISKNERKTPPPPGVGRRRFFITIPLLQNSRSGR